MIFIWRGKMILTQIYGVIHLFWLLKMRQHHFLSPHLNLTGPIREEVWSLCKPSDLVQHKVAQTGNPNTFGADFLRRILHYIILLTAFTLKAQPAYRGVCRNYLGITAILSQLPPLSGAANTLDNWKEVNGEGVARSTAIGGRHEAEKSICVNKRWLKT